MLILGSIQQIFITKAYTQITNNDQVILDSFYNGTYRKFGNKNTLSINTTTGDTTYYCQLVSVSTFDTLLKPIINKVVLDNNNLINTGTAYALTADAAQAKFNINFSWLNSKISRNPKYWNIGFAASSSSKFFQIFSKDEWQQGFGLSFGITKAINAPFEHYTDPEKYCEKKNRFLLVQLSQLHQALEQYSINISKRNELDRSKILSKNVLALSQLTQNLEDQEIGSVDELTKIENQIESVDYLRNVFNSRKLDLYIDSIFTDFEKANVKISEYKIKWYNLKILPQYKATSIYDTAAARVLGVSKNEYLRLAIEGSYNFAYSSKDALFFWTFGAGIQNSNSLEGKKADQLEFLKINITDSSTILTSTKGLAIDNYNAYKKQFMLITPSLGFNWFWGSNRTFGWETFISGKIGVRKSSYPFKNLYTARTGLLVSLKGKSELAKSTFGLLAEWTDKEFKTTNYHDYFTLSIRIGIPFSY